MEKRVPHYSLAGIQAKVAAVGIAAFSKAAIDGGRAMGLKSAEMLQVVLGLQRQDFYKSMTTYADSKVWQDVYHAAVETSIGPNTAYIKLTMFGEDRPPVIQFKEK